MKIVIIRHAQAESYASSDKLRCLTEQGIIEAKSTGKWLNQHKIKPDKILVSPYLRTQHTANILVSELTEPPNVLEKITILNFITPDGNATEIHDYLDAIISVEKHQQLIIVSHMPLVSYLLTKLTFDNTMLSFQTAMAVEVDYNIEQAKGRVIRKYSPV